MAFVVVDTAVEIDAAAGSVAVEAVADTAVVVVVDTEPGEVRFEYTADFAVVTAGTVAVATGREYIAAVVSGVAVSIAVATVETVLVCMVEVEAVEGTVAAAFETAAVVQAWLGTAFADLSPGLETFEKGSALDSGVGEIRPGTVCYQQSVQLDWRPV
jgi:hypothetical protein